MCARVLLQTLFLLGALHANGKHGRCPACCTHDDWLDPMMVTGVSEQNT